MSDLSTSAQAGMIKRLKILDYIHPVFEEGCIQSKALVRRYKIGGTLWSA